VLLTAAIAVPEMPVKLISLLFCYTLGLMGIISPYATGPGPIYYGSGYVSRKDFWMLGLIFGAIYLAVLLVIGVPYLRYYLSESHGWWKKRNSRVTLAGLFFSWNQTRSALP
jgi:di/tricarboxylate transporter